MLIIHLVVGDGRLDRMRRHGITSHGIDGQLWYSNAVAGADDSGATPQNISKLALHRAIHFHEILVGEPALGSREEGLSSTCNIRARSAQRVAYNAREEHYIE
jgi:hypothetical protein